MNNTPSLEALDTEYQSLQSILDSFDTKTLTIKTWSVTVGMTGIGGAFVSHSPALLLLSSFSALVFWILETYWKTFQSAHFARITEIEKYTRGEIEEIVPLQMSRSWNKAYRSRTFRKTFKIFWFSNVAMPHGIVVLFGIVVFMLSHLEIVKV